MRRKLTEEHQAIIDALECAVTGAMNRPCKDCPFYQKGDCHEALIKEIKRWARELEEK